ncbi:PDZK1-interacting protein 1 isoform X7 [Takifugu rubripes]|uniref:PDZK1-interacting protein 1 isoform X7 n=1 Tax=Takifugu rubripes TaxID=31033 RepID=UPI0005D2764C|nr:small integral membrane protein 24 isoform X7 [Takifugu rubripes]|eukprot:XP_011616994.1 PREDICTED: small integral membrane protein 24 isoform X2 [Takifugu rubripes]
MIYLRTPADLISRSDASRLQSSGSSSESTMKNRAEICCLLLMVAAVAAQTERSQAERALPQWLTGIIAVAGFLLLAFVALLVNRAWCGKSSYKDVESDERRSEATYDTSLNTLSSKGIDNAYANVAFSADEKVTAM